MTTRLAIDRLDAADAAAVADMTFPAYRHLLTLEPAARHPPLGDQRLVTPFGVVARVDGHPVGLALGEQPLATPSGAEVLSLFVEADHRHRGIATQLLVQMEESARRAGAARLHATFMLDPSRDTAIRRVLEKSGWAPPETRSLLVRFTPEQAVSAPWFNRQRPPVGFEVFSWSELSSFERTQLRRSHADRPWVTTGLEFWRHEPLPLDRIASVGARFRGQVVGWLLTHRLGGDTIRFTCAFIRADLARRALLVPLIRESITRLRLEGRVTACTFVTMIDQAAMVRFIRKRCAPWAELVAETKVSWKRLVQAS